MDRTKVDNIKIMGQPVTGNIKSNIAEIFSQMASYTKPSECYRAIQTLGHLMVNVSIEQFKTGEGDEIMALINLTAVELMRKGSKLKANDDPFLD